MQLCLRSGTCLKQNGIVCTTKSQAPALMMENKLLVQHRLHPLRNLLLRLLRLLRLLHLLHFQSPLQHPPAKPPSSPVQTPSATVPAVSSPTQPFSHACPIISLTRQSQMQTKLSHVSGTTSSLHHIRCGLLRSRICGNNRLKSYGHSSIRMEGCC